MIRNTNRRHAKAMSREGFTLIEILAVMAILVILVGLAIGITGHAQRSARVGRARADLEKIHNALQDYMMNKGSCPAALPEELTILKDPWGQPYQYTNTGTKSYLLMSMGPDTTITEDDILSGR